MLIEMAPKLLHIYTFGVNNTPFAIFLQFCGVVLKCIFGKLKYDSFSAIIKIFI